MFEYIIEKDNTFKTLKEEDKEKVVTDIASMFESWDNVRQKQKSIADKLRPEIYLDKRETEKQSEESWKSDVHLNKIYALFQTQQAFIWDNIYSHIENLFDVQGTDELSVQMANLQKKKLVDTFTKIGIQRKLDMAIENLGSIGEMCLFISWRKKYKQRRHRLEMLDGKEKLLLRQGEFGIFSQEIYNGANVEALNPLNLVFDPRVMPEDTEHWDSCGKIIKSWESYASLSDNKLYHLTAEELKDIRQMLAVPKLDKDKPESEKTDDIIDSDRIEVLQYWGDYAMPDGTVLKNWHIVVVGRRYLAAFEPNRWVINPIINMALFRDYESKRGIPELWSIYDLCKEQEKKVNLQNDAQSLNLNPPAYAPEGFFKDKEITLFPGKQVEYKQGLEDPSSIIRMTFPLLSNENIIQYYDETASTVSGIFPNMQGMEESKDATATEINIKVHGQTTRLSKILDTIKQNAIVPMVSKVAELEANMKFGEELIFMNEEGQSAMQRIGDVVRQGNYEYRYTDSSGAQRKILTNNMLRSILSLVWHDKDVPLNKPEIIREALTNIGIENTEKFFQNTPDASASPNASANALKNLAALMPNLPMPNL